MRALISRLNEVAALAAMLGTGICLAAVDRPRPPDTTPPAAVSTLTATSGAFGWISLRWIAVGDDGGGTGACGGAGTATSYDIRYSMSSPADAPFNGNVDAWFAAATAASAEPLPRGCGINDSFCLGDLIPGGTYYIAMQVADEAGNTSGVSNVATGTPGAVLGGSLHVSDVVASWTYAGGARKRPIAFVYIQDEFGTPVEGATLTINMTGCTTENGLSGISDCSGRAVIPGSRTSTCPNACCFVVHVVNVSHGGYVYDSGANVETCASGKCDPFSPNDCLPCE